MAMTTDLVCGMRIDTDDAVETAELDGTTYYFCSQVCHDAFVANPGSYVTREPTERPGHDAPS